MSRKSGNRFCEQDMRNQDAGARPRFHHNVTHSGGRLDAWIEILPGRRMPMRYCAGASTATFFQLSSGLNDVILSASFSVLGPRSFWYTVPS